MWKDSHSRETERVCGTFRKVFYDFALFGIKFFFLPDDNFTYCIFFILISAELISRVQGHPLVRYNLVRYNVGNYIKIISFEISQSNPPRSALDAGSGGSRERAAAEDCLDLYYSGVNFVVVYIICINHF